MHNINKQKLRLITLKTIIDIFMASFWYLILSWGPGLQTKSQIMKLSDFKTVIVYVSKEYCMTQYTNSYRV